MSRIVKTTDASYKVAVASGGVITLDTGDHLGSVDITNDLNVAGDLNFIVDPGSGLPVSNINSVVDINASGNISGTWNGKTIDVAHGGTGATTIPPGAVIVGKVRNGTNTISSVLPGPDGNILTSNGSEWISKETVPLMYKRITTAYTASAGDKLIVDSSAGTFTVILPASPTVGDFISAVDGADWGVNNVIFDRNGHTINGTAEDLLADVGNLTVDLIFDGTTWKAFVSPYPPELPPISGNTGKYLYTNGLQVSWENIPPATTITDDVVSNTVQYLSMVKTTSGAMTDAMIASTKLYFTPSTGALTATEVNTLSDKNLKTDIETLTNSIDVIRKIRPVRFKWTSNKKTGIGVIAQELEEILPELVDSTSAIKSVSYMQLIAFLIDAIQHQDKEIELLKQHLGDK